VIVSQYDGEPIQDAATASSVFSYLREFQSMIPAITPPTSKTAGRQAARSSGGWISATLAATLMLLQSACAANTPSEAVTNKTRQYYQDAQLCRAKNPSKTADRSADPAASIDATGYLRCLDTLGYHQEAKTDPFLKALEVCQQGKTSVSARGTRTVRPPSPTAFRDCLKQRGFASAGTPPVAPAIPAAAVPVKPPSPPVASSPDGAAAKERIQTLYIPRKVPAAP
jgi:hypothetical protein